MFIFSEIGGRFFVEQLGAFGLNPFGEPKEAGNTGSLWEYLREVHPFSLVNFNVKSGLEGPQAVLTWEAPAKPIARLMIRRKLGEFPVDPSDGILVLDELEQANTLLSLNDSALANILRVLEKDFNIPSTTVAMADSLFDTFDTDRDGVLNLAVISDFISNYETRFQISLPDFVKTPDTKLQDFVLEAQKQEFLQGPQTSDSNWWYYRAFVQPDLAELKGQFAGQGEQKLEQISYVGQTLTLGSTIFDIQEFKNVRILIHNSTTAPITVAGYTFPEKSLPSESRLSSVPSAGLVVPGTNVVIQAGQTEAVELSDLSLKHFVLVAVTQRNSADLGDEFVNINFIVNKLIHFQSNHYLSLPCLVYKTGEHQEVIWDRRSLPSVHVGFDEHPDRSDKQALPLEVAERLAAPETINFYEGGQEQGPLYRFLKIFSLELDRNKHYLKALTEFNADITSAPREVLSHIAYELGWEVDTSRPLSSVRMELLQLAAMYKKKGTTELFEAVGAQQTRILPRVQEGQGLVHRVADPSRFDGNIAREFLGPFYVLSEGPAVVNRAQLPVNERSGFFYPLYLTEASAGGPGNFDELVVPEFPSEVFYVPKLQFVKGGKVRPEGIQTEFSSAYSISLPPTDAGKLSAQEVVVANAAALNLAGISSGDVS